MMEAEIETKLELGMDDESTGTSTTAVCPALDNQVRMSVTVFDFGALDICHEFKKSAHTSREGLPQLQST